MISAGMEHLRAGVAMQASQPVLCARVKDLHAAQRSRTSRPIPLCQPRPQHGLAFQTGRSRTCIVSASERPPGGRSDSLLQVHLLFHACLCCITGHCAHNV